MGSFFVPPQFSPIEPVLPNGTNGSVLTIVGNRRAWAAAAAPPASLGTRAVYVTAAGANNNIAVAAGVGRLDIDTSAGAASLTGIALSGVTDGYLLNVRCIGANPKYLTLNSMNAGSSAANQIQLPSDLTLPQYDALLLCYYGGSINKWCMA